MIIRGRPLIFFISLPKREYIGVNNRVLVMKSIFHSETTVTVNGVQFTLEADQTMEGTELLKVTNETTGDTARCRLKGAHVVRDGMYGFDNLPEDMKDAILADGTLEVPTTA